MARRAKKLIPWHVPCPACGAGLLSVGCKLGSGGWHCRACGPVSDVTPTARVRPCSLGQAWVLPYLGAYDELPEVCASGLPFWTTQEVAWLATLDAPTRAREWQRRALAAIKERSERAQDPKRTVTRGSKPAQEEA